MSDFAGLRRELGLKKFLASQLGTLYFVPYASAAPRIIVRHFDAALPPELAPTYADLVRAAQRWIERNPAVNALARIDLPTDVGDDYVTRRHHIYTASTDTYYDDEDPVEAPPEWQRLLAALQAMPSQADERDTILADTVRRSLAEPNSKTYFDEGEGRFIVVDPDLNAEDVRRWGALRE
jgi:hypothetical protein